MLSPTEESNAYIFPGYASTVSVSTPIIVVIVEME